MTDAKLSVAVLQRIADFLSELPEADVADLAEGRARLALIPAGASTPRAPRTRSAPTRRVTAPASAADMGQAREALAGMSSREEGTAYLSALGVKELKALAALLDMRGVSGLRKDRKSVV